MGGRPRRIDHRTLRVVAAVRRSAAKTCTHTSYGPSAVSRDTVDEASSLWYREYRSYKRGGADGTCNEAWGSSAGDNVGNNVGDGDEGELIGLSRTVS